MKFKQGWSGQVSSNPDRWAKVDVTLEEEDLRRLLVRCFKSTRDLDDFLSQAITPGLAYILLELEAEILIYQKLLARYGYPEAEGNAKLDALSAKKKDLLSRLAETYQR